MNKNNHLVPSRIVILSFIAMIFIGAFLLMLPISSRNGTWTPFLDALFTSTSASCVTGLIVYDTYSHWSLFGQFIIILLIQIGGLGVVTMAMFLAMVTGKKIGFRSRNLMKQSIDAPQSAGILRAVLFILKGTIFIESIAAILLSIRFIPEFGFLKGIWMSIFHSISGFCNAGFDLMGQKAPFSSLTSYQGDGLVLGVISCLIVIGGLGFFVWDDLMKHKLKFKKYRLQTKVVLATTACLILIPALFFFFYEFNQPEWSYMTFTERLFSSLFESITTRTAGFNSINYDHLHSASLPLYIVLMLIGGSSGSTAGGFKTTTLAVLVVTLISIFSKKEGIHVFNRRLPNTVIHHTIAIISLYLSLFLMGGILLCMFDGLSISDSFFEVASALGTVGLTLGITSNLSTASHLVLIVLMFLGRVGSLTMLFALSADRTQVASTVPQESISIG